MGVKPVVRTQGLAYRGTDRLDEELKGEVEGFIRLSAAFNGYSDAEIMAGRITWDENPENAAPGEWELRWEAAE